ncbi:carboxylating nicotinate-nucleotide diphosphorylase [Promicromonospora vindobonensis]|uniref:nicotinate-nucleotide diphosphorylase (carboxylating) n=1 Tax=Promicromonospora vindobonensis TaxID=195748 RepID=A0ABW5VT73_9MICO
MSTLPVFATPSTVTPGLDAAWVARTVEVALDEDLGPAPGRDVTSQATIPPSDTGAAELVAREDGVIAGLVVVGEVLDQVATRLDLPRPNVTFHAQDGDAVTAGQVLATLEGRTLVLLVAERTLLNLASRASGVATVTRAFAGELAGTGAQVLDTRKTTPGLRALQKYAVRAGGGTNKRMGLYDVAMVKDNHVVAAGSVAAAVRAVRERFPDVPVQVEADTTAQALEALASGADFLLLDNMDPDRLAETVAAVREREGHDGVPAHVLLEATGNLTLDKARKVAGTGVDFLSVGALTHSAGILDLALDLRPGTQAR